MKKVVDATNAKIVVCSLWKVRKKNVYGFKDNLYKNLHTKEAQTTNQEKMCDFVNSIYDIIDSNGTFKG